jgi:aminoglycoside phosphotransferase family enzyme/predicted kinase
VDPPGEMRAPAGVAETHISTLFLVGDRVYKLRKPVQFGFLDFRQRDVRRLDCEREVALNRRLAPDVYLGVADVQFDGEPIDHMVVMRRMPESRRLAALVGQGTDSNRWLRQVAKTLAAFHSKAARSPDISAAATGAMLQAGWEANFAETENFVGTILDRTIETEIRSLALRWTEGREPLLSERIASGRVCDGHGDLQAEDIFCLDDGVRILDCIEFCDQLRYCDVIADVAFLAMDLERLGHPAAATRFLLDYQELAGDRFPTSLVHYYCASRAYVRAKVCCFRSAQGADDAREEARLLHALALSHLRQAQVTVVLVGGLPGSGKSTIAAGLGAARGWTVFRSDEIRREMSRITEERVPGYLMGDYSPAATGAVYSQLIRQAELLLESGKSVILDASWVDAAWRDAARVMADHTGSDLVELRCDVTPEEADRRIVRRLSENADASDATPKVRAAMSRSMDPWVPSAVIDTSGTKPEEAIALAMGVLSKGHMI